MLWIGLMSGTSADAVDVALVRIGDSVRDLEILALRSEAYFRSLQDHIHSLSERSLYVREIARLNIEIGERFAAAALGVLADAGVRPEQVEGIGSHGQTVGHFPEPEVRASVQLGSAAVIAERTRISVVSDFRAADLAAGGQGAPLTPFFHHAFFAREGECRAILNIGGFTNVTVLPGADPDAVMGFDPGPGNALLDRAARWLSNGAAAFDRDGVWTGAGQPHDALVDELMRDAYFEKPPPKSTGHEHFGPAFFEQARAGVEERGGTPDDLLATLLRVTVESVAHLAERFFPQLPQRWIVYGGGVSNRALLEALRSRLSPAPVELTDVHGIPVDAHEAISFAVLGWCASRGESCNLPAATGAGQRVVLGVKTPPGGS